MPVFATANPGPLADGVFYCQNQPLPAAENDLYNLPGIANNVDPVPIWCEQGISASVYIVANGQVNSGTNYVILQTDMNDGNWLDVCGLVFTGFGNAIVSNGPNAGLFLMSSSAPGVVNVFQQTRLFGTAPAVNFTNACVLGGRVRFTGKTTATLGSSGSSASLTAGLPQGMLCTIKYRRLGLN